MKRGTHHDHDLNDHHPHHHHHCDRHHRQYHYDYCPHNSFRHPCERTYESGNADAPTRTERDTQRHRETSTCMHSFVLIRTTLGSYH